MQDGCGHGKEKVEKPQRKTLKKVKPAMAPAGSTDYKDNYEGDCDDDEYDKEKSGNRWKTMKVTRSNGKSNYYPEANSKVAVAGKNVPRKKEPAQKRRASEKNRPKHQYQQCESLEVEFDFFKGLQT